MLQIMILQLTQLVYTFHFRNDNIEFVKPKQTQNNANEIPEVQAAMQANELLTKNTGAYYNEILLNIL